MRAKLVFGVVAATALSGLSTVWAESAASATTEKAATAGEKAMKVFIVEVKGGG